jgi:hypothetical protein
VDGELFTADGVGDQRADGFEGLFAEVDAAPQVKLDGGVGGADKLGNAGAGVLLERGVAIRFDGQPVPAQMYGHGAPLPKHHLCGHNSRWQGRACCCGATKGRVLGDRSWVLGLRFRSGGQVSGFEQGDRPIIAYQSPANPHF